MQSQVSIIQEQLASAEATLSELDQRTPNLAYEDAIGLAGANKALASHLAAVEAAKSRRDLKARALEVAQQHDRGAESERIAVARGVPPEMAIAGVTRKRCPDLCADGSCALAGGVNRCMHPHKGGIPPAYANDRVLRSFQTAASDAIHQQELKAQHHG